MKFENNEILEVENTPENVEQTTEETVVVPEKKFTQEDLNAAVGKAKARERAKITKQYDRKYGDLMATLQAGTGKESVEEVNDTFQKFYASKGVKMPQKPEYSAKDIEKLAKSDADEFIAAGHEDVVEEVDRLADIGIENMTAREKATFKILAEYRKNAERSRELTTLGASEDEITSKQFQDFAKKFAPDTPMADIYDIYKAKYPKAHPKTMGSLKQGQTGKVKDFYTPDEIARLSEDDLRDPVVWAAVRRSMTGK